MGAGLVFPQIASGQKGLSKKPDDINVALLGAGEQGRVLMNICLKIPGIRFRAVCDIWTAYNQKRVINCHCLIIAEYLKQKGYHVEHIE